MKNQPKSIYLIVGADGESKDFEELVGVSWCEDKINDDDLGYLSFSFIFARIKELENRNYDTMSADGVYNFNMDSNIINELKQLIKNGK